MAHEPRELNVVCPAGVQAGDRLAVLFEGQTYEVELPAGIGEGETFSAVVQEPAAEQGGSSTATPAQLAGMQHMVREMATGFLAGALSRLLQAMEHIYELQEWVDANSAAFADYHRGCEHSLRWTELHTEYVRRVDAGVAAELGQLQCTPELVFDYAKAYGGDPRTDKLLAKLLAMSDYEDFCAMMHGAYELGPSAC